ANDGAEGDEFGIAVAISDTIAVVGAQGDDDDGVNSGSAYVFNVATGEFMTKLSASDAKFDDRFGASVAIGDGVVMVGAPGDDSDAGVNSGAVYLFDEDTKAP